MGGRKQGEQHARTLAETLNEARWAYERRHLDRLSYQAIADLSGATVPDGGLGRSMTIGTARKRVAEYRDTLAVALDDETRDEQRAAELADLDRQQRAFTSLLSRVDDVASAQRAFAMNTTLDVLREQRPDLLVLRDEKQIMRALDSLRSIGESRRKLLGIDAPNRVTATVDLVNHDALIEELNAELFALGEEPVAVE
ncbi:hypothetical protein [Microbacterium sp.]|uniref:hypothetical protein n=1 Tax=Microbacterium sp. TaxID=51671 RepID=UPI003C7113F5